jgi:transcriptional regulator with XRE-family HTH domain
MSSERPLVARRIEEIRKAKRMSRRDLATKLGTSYLQVYRNEKGITEVSAEDAATYAAALEISVASLYRESRAAS